MENKCSNPSCDNLLVHIEGRRKKKYCSAKCKNKVTMATFLAKPKDQKTKRITTEEYVKLKTPQKFIEVKGAGELDGYTFLFQECDALNDLKEKDDDVLSKMQLWFPSNDDRKNPFTNAARGRDESGINEDEIKNALNSTETKKEVKADSNFEKHKLWKKGDPSENTNAFFMRYECWNYTELETIKAHKQ